MPGAFLWDNKAVLAAISAPGGGAYRAVNLLDERPAFTWRTADGVEVEILLSWGEATGIDTVILTGANVPTVSIQGADDEDFTAPVVNETLSVGDNGNGHLCLDSPASHAFWRLKIPAQETGSGWYEAACLLMGVRNEYRFFEDWHPRRFKRQVSEVVRNRRGGVYGDKLYEQEVFEGETRWMTTEEEARFAAMWSATAGLLSPVAYIPDMALPGVHYVRGASNTGPDDYPFTRFDPDTWEGALSLEEAL